MVKEIKGIKDELYKIQLILAFQQAKKRLLAFIAILVICFLVSPLSIASPVIFVGIFIGVFFYLDYEKQENFLTGKTVTVVIDN